jgi:hypothetical protein
LICLEVVGQQIKTTHGIVVQMTRDRSVCSLEQVEGVQVVTEDVFFQLAIKSDVLSASSSFGFIKSSVGSPFAVPQSPLNGLAITLGI